MSCVNVLKLVVRIYFQLLNPINDECVTSIHQVAQSNGFRACRVNCKDFWGLSLRNVLAIKLIPFQMIYVNLNANKSCKDKVYLIDDLQLNFLFEWLISHRHLFVILFLLDKYFIFFQLILIDFVITVFHNFVNVFYFTSKLRIFEINLNYERKQRSSSNPVSVCLWKIRVLEWNCNAQHVIVVFPQFFISGKLRLVGFQERVINLRKEGNFPFASCSTLKKILFTKKYTNKKSEFPAKQQDFLIKNFV